MNLMTFESGSAFVSAGETITISIEAIECIYVYKEDVTAIQVGGISRLVKGDYNTVVERIRRVVQTIN